MITIPKHLNDGRKIWNPTEIEWGNGYKCAFYYIEENMVFLSHFDITYRSGYSVERFKKLIETGHFILINQDNKKFDNSDEPPKWG